MWNLDLVISYIICCSVLNVFVVAQTASYTQITDLNMLRPECRKTNRMCWNMCDMWPGWFECVVNLINRHWLLSIRLLMNKYNYLNCQCFTLCCQKTMHKTFKLREQVEKVEQECRHRSTDWMEFWPWQCFLYITNKLNCIFNLYDKQSNHVISLPMKLYLHSIVGRHTAIPAKIVFFSNEYFGQSGSLLLLHSAAGFEMLCRYSRIA